MADITTQRLVSKIDYPATFVNTLTDGHPLVGKTPAFLPSDQDAIAAALHVCGPIDHQRAKVVRIENTQELDALWISETLYDMVKGDLQLQETIEAVSEPREMQFDVLGNLAR